MADNFEKAKDEILRRTAGNGGPDNADILVAMSALAQDGDDQHGESLAEVKALKGLLTAHCEEAKVRDDRILSLENWKSDQSKNCVERVKKLIADEHRSVHEAHMVAEHRAPRRRDDPKDASYEGDRRVWLMWNIGSKITYILMAVIITVLNIAVHYLLMGEP